MNRLLFVISASTLSTVLIAPAHAFLELMNHANSRHYRSLQIAEISLTDGPADLRDFCTVLQRSFESNVRCDCFGSTQTFLSVSCEYLEPVCHEDTCGRPILGITIVDGRVFSSTTCMQDYVRRGTEVLGDTCIAVTACEDPKKGLCECMASYRSDVCRTCEVCGGGKGLRLDCTNVDVNAMSAPSCTEMDLDLDLRHAGFLGDFVPRMSDLCGALESKLDNRIKCDCTDANSSGMYAVKCEMVENSTVQSTAEIVNGAVSSVTTCSEETCTAMQLCPGNDKQVCACVATYRGRPCNSCQVCEGGGGLQLDCSMWNQLLLRSNVSL